MSTRRSRSTAEPGVSQTELQQQHRAALKEQGKDQYEVITGAEITKENQDAIQKQLSFFNIALLIFALIALIVGSVIIYNTFSIVVAQRTREMALLRAIGASQRQVMGQVFGESVVVGVLASFVGVAVGRAPRDRTPGPHARVRHRLPQHPGRDRAECDHRGTAGRDGGHGPVGGGACPSGRAHPSGRGLARRRDRAATAPRHPPRDRGRCDGARHRSAVRRALRQCQQRHRVRGNRRVVRLRRCIRTRTAVREKREPDHRRATSAHQRARPARSPGKTRPGTPSEPRLPRPR